MLLCLHGHVDIKVMAGILVYSTVLSFTEEAVQAEMRRIAFSPSSCSVQSSSSGSVADHTAIAKNAVLSLRQHELSTASSSDNIQEVQFKPKYNIVKR